MQALDAACCSQWALCTGAHTCRLSLLCMRALTWLPRSCCAQGPESGEDEEIGNGIEGSLSCPTAGSVGQPGLSCLARSASDGSTTASALPNGNSEGLTQGQEEGGLLGSAGGSNERLAQAIPPRSNSRTKHEHHNDLMLRALMQRTACAAAPCGAQETSCPHAAPACPPISPHVARVYDSNGSCPTPSCPPAATGRKYRQR